MTPENFCYWLQGIFEIQRAGLDRGEKAVVKLSESQIDMIAWHLQSVFKPQINYEKPPTDTASMIASLGTETKIC